MEYFNEWIILWDSQRGRQFLTLILSIVERMAICNESRFIFHNVMKANSYFALIHKLFLFLEHKYTMKAGIDIWYSIFCNAICIFIILWITNSGVAPNITLQPSLKSEAWSITASYYSKIGCSALFKPAELCS